MPVINIAGFNVFVPDLTDLTSYVTTPINNFIQQQIAVITNALSFVADQVYQKIITPIQNFIASAVNTASNTIGNFVNAANQLLIQPIYGFIQSLFSGFQNTITSIINAANQNIIIPISNYVSGLFNQLRADLSNMINAANSHLLQPILNGFNLIPSYLNNFETLIVNDITTYLVNPVSQFINNNVVQPIGNLQKFTVAAFNQFTTDLNSFAANVSTTLSNLGINIVNGITAFDSQVVSPILQGIETTFTTGFISLYQPIKDLLFSKISDDPTIALEQLTARTAAIGTTVVSTIAALKVLENVHPFHTLQLEEGFKHILEFVGVYDLGRETLKLFVDNGIGLQAEYALNYQFQAKKLSVGEAVKGVWYGVRSVDTFATDARFEGYEDDAINTLSKTLYKPLPPFILERLISLQIGTPDFYTNQLLKEGFDPADVPTLLNIFQNLSVTGFQSNAKSLIFLMYKDGLLDETLAKQIMTAFIVPDNEQKWILQLANYQYGYEQKNKLITLIVDEISKGLYKDPNSAVSDLTSLGLSSDRATVLVKTAAVKSFTTLAKADKDALLQSFLPFIAS